MRGICLEPKQQPTLKCHSRFTKKGKVMACKILFSFKVCSTCFNFTTFKFEANHQNYILFKSRLLIYYNTCYITRLVPKSNVIIHVEWPTIANTAHQECSNLMYGTNVLKRHVDFIQLLSWRADLRIPRRTGCYIQLTLYISQYFEIREQHSNSRRKKQSKRLTSYS